MSLKPSNPFEELAERFVAWAQTQPDIRGILNVGSRARTKVPADSLSDLDLVVITTSPSRYLTETAWFERLGEVTLTFIEPTTVAQQFERRVLYRGGLDVDFSIFPNDALRKLVDGGLPTEVQDVLRRGYRVLMDKDETLGKLKAFPARMPSPPTAQEFNQHIDDFLYHAVWTAKKIKRGELWIAKFCCDAYMKILLLRMIEWHARALHGWDYDTWFNGRFLERWGDQEVVAELEGVFAHYHSDDVKKALLHTVQMHRRLSTETGNKLGYQTADAKYSETIRLMKDYMGD